MLQFRNRAAAAIIIALLAMAGCENSKLRKLPDAELAEKSRECNATNSPTPILAEVCKNVERECRRRREELNVYVC